MNMKPETRVVKSTSLRSATTEDVILRETQTRRLVFRPILVVNERRPDAAVNGAFIYQRKGKAGTWEDIKVPPLSSLKADQAVKLELHSEELKRLHREVSMLYDVYQTHGIPRGEAKFIKATAAVQALAEMADEELTAIIGGHQEIGAEALSRLVTWASNEKNFSLLFDRLQQLGNEALMQLNSALGVASLKRALLKWLENRDNADEEFWQKLLAGHAFVLEQLFQVPVLVVKSKAYVGGKSVLNKGGRIVDFLVQNKITSAVALVEIKTPKTPLLGSEYRAGVYNISVDLSGAVMQVLSYRDSLAQERLGLLGDEGIRAEAFDPMCVVVIGHAEKELDNDAKRRSFELYRRQLSASFHKYGDVFSDESSGREARLKPAPDERLRGTLIPPPEDGG